MRNGSPDLKAPNIPMHVEHSPASPRSISHPQLGNIPSASEIRRILSSLIAHNCLGRDGTLEKETLSKPVEPRAEIQTLLTDDICNNFVRQMRVVEEQRGSLPLNGTVEPSNMDNSKVPKTTHAMLISEKANSSSTPSDEGIAIPFHPQFFPHAKGMEREEGEITSSKPSSVTSDVPHWPSPPKRYSIDGGKRPRRSPTPEPARHRQPSSRTYLHRSPECLVRPLSGRSQSPSHPRRPISPEYMTGRRTHSPEGPRRRRSTPGAKIPQTFEPAPPRSPRSAMHKRRGSDYDARRSNDSGESYVSRENYKESTYPEGHKDAFMARDVSNHNRGRESTGERDSVESLHTKPSINSNDHKTDHRRSFSGGLTTPSPSSASRPLPDAASSSQLVKPCHNVPGLWMVKSGRKNIEIVTCEFEIDKITADRWGVRGSSTHGKEKAHEALSLSLACVPLSEIVALQGRLDLASAPPQEIANEMAQIKTVWPPAGHLVVQINHDQEWGRSWLPRHLGEEQSSINIVNYVHEGTNVIRLIHLAGLVDHMFMVLAKEKPPDMGTMDYEPEMVVVGAVREGPMAMELNSFVATTRTIYS